MKAIDARRTVLPIGVVAVVCAAIISGWLQFQSSLEDNIEKAVTNAMKPTNVLIDEMGKRLASLDADTDKHAEKPYHQGMPAYVDAKVERLDDDVDDLRLDLARIKK